MTTTDQILDEVKSAEADAPTLSARVDKLEENQGEIKASLLTNTRMTSDIRDSTADLVATTDFFRKLAKVVMWVGALGAGLYGCYQGWEFIQKLTESGL